MVMCAINSIQLMYLAALNILTCIVSLQNYVRKLPFVFEWPSHAANTVPSIIQLYTCYIYYGVYGSIWLLIHCCISSEMGIGWWSAPFKGCLISSRSATNQWEHLVNLYNLMATEASLILLYHEVLNNTKLLTLQNCFQQKSQTQYSQ